MTISRSRQAVEGWNSDSSGLSWRWSIITASAVPRPRCTSASLLFDAAHRQIADLVKRVGPLILPD